MKSTRALPGAIVVGAVAVASMFAAAPASAATLPPGQKITVIDSVDDQFYNVNPADALGTPVGTPDGIDQLVTGTDVDDSGTGYAVATQEFWPEDAVEVDLPWSQALRSYVEGGYIYRADANTGKLTDGKPVLIATDVPEDWADECSAIDFSKGGIIAVCYTYSWFETEDSEEVELAGYWDMTAYIGTVDVSDPDHAVLTPLATLVGDGFRYFAAIAKNPIDGQLIGFDYWYNEAYYITFDGEFPEYIDDLDEFVVWGADYDRGGQLWLSVAPAVDTSRIADFESFFSLATFNFATAQPDEVAPFGSNDPYEVQWPQSITIWGVLAATGSTGSLVPALAASGILLLGALLAAGTMVLRRRSADA